MKNYRLTQEFEIMEEDMTRIKDVSVHLVVSTKEIKEDRIIKMLSQFAHELSVLIMEESSEIEKGFAALNERLMSESEKTGKRWFK